jgi:hypothetical protein
MTDPSLTTPASGGGRSGAGDAGGGTASSVGGGGGSTGRGGGGAGHPAVADASAASAPILATQATLELDINIGRRVALGVDLRTVKARGGRARSALGVARAGAAA